MVESRISALVDGELEHEDAKSLLISAKDQARFQQDWELYHLIGDTLRETQPLSPGFSAKVTDRLAREPRVLAPRRLLRPKKPLLILSAAASAAAVFVVAWAALHLNGDSDLAGQNANNAVANSTAAVPASVNGYLRAHREYAHAAPEGSAYQRAAFEGSRSEGR